MEDSLDHCRIDNYMDLKVKFATLCKELNVDSNAELEAWNEFTKINMNVSLEGDSLHWLACALYVSCRKSSVIREQLSLDVEGIPLGKLLLKVKLSLIYFFQKIRKWLEMGKHGSIMNEKIEQLERVFSVSSIVFEKYSSIFNEIYKENWTEQIKRGRKKQAMGTKEIFNFCWILYLATKAQYPDIGDDLVNSYHLLLCCLDFTFSNTLTIKVLKGAIHPDFKGAPENFFTHDFNDSDVPSIIDVLCNIHEGLPIETKIIRKQHLGTFIDELLRNGHLKGNVDKSNGLLEITNFDSNMKYFNDSYEKHIFRSSGIDERIFINEDSSTLIGILSRRVTTFTDFTPDTPLTGRQWLKEKRECSTADLSITLGVSRLQELVKGLKPSPSEKLKEMMVSMKENPEEDVKMSLSNFSTVFLEEYLKSAEDSASDVSSEDRRKDFVKARLQLAIILFYKTLENFLDAEINQKKSTADLSVLLRQEMFVKCLFTCCLEIVIYSYKSSRVFPWILTSFDLEPYHFFKIIELVIRSEDLSRDVIKHLSRVEEQILESLSWQSGSPIYDVIAVQGIPKCQEVSADAGFSTPLRFMSPTNIRMSKDGLLHSPNMAISGKLCSPAASPARRNLFGTPVKSDAQSSVANTKTSTAVILPPKTTANSTQGFQFPIMLASPGQSPVRLYPVTPQRGSPQTGSIIRISASPSKNNTKKYGSLGIFFRKLYHMSSVRLKDLCENLGIGSELQKKIWTCFEHSLIDNTNILRDRHIDQMIMCAVYVIAKVTKEEKSFHEIMKWYRTQPQAHSDVYRKVLIKRTSSSESSSPKSDDQNSPTENKKEGDNDTNGKSNNTTCEQKHSDANDSDKYVYNDLIQFYNIVYIKKIKDFALKFAANKVEVEALSPLPVTRKQVHSPRKLSTQHQVYISPIKPTPSMTPRSKVLYCFDTDSPKKLSEINAMIKGGTRRKVNLDDDPTGPNPPKRQLNGLAKRAQELRKEQGNMPMGTRSLSVFSS